MNVTGIKAKAPAKNELPPGSLSWGLVHEVGGPHATAVKAVAALSDGSGLFTSGKAGIRRWDAEKASSEEFASAQAAGGLVHSLAVVGADRLWAGLGDGRLAVFDLETGQALHKFPGHKGEIVCIAGSRDGEAVFTGGIDFQVKMWSRDGEARCSSGHHHGAVNALLVLEEEGELWAGSADGTISAMPKAAGSWSVSEEAAGFLRDAAQKAVSCMLAVGEDTVWAGCDDGTVVVWGRDEKAVRGTVQGHSARVSCLTTLGHHVWSGGADKAIVGYDAASMEQLYRLPDQGSFVKDMATLGWAVWAFNAKNCRLYTSDTCVSAEASRADTAEARALEGEARERALQGELEEAQRKLQAAVGSAEEQEAKLRKDLEELEEQRTAEVGALKSGADVDKQGLLEQIQALAAEKSEVENRLEDAVAAAAEAEEALRKEVEQERAAKARAGAALEEAVAARKADEVRNMEKVAALEDDKAKTIAQMVEDKNAMIDRIRSDLDAQNQVVAAAKEAQAAAEAREGELREELEASRAEASGLESRVADAQEQLQAKGAEMEAAVVAARGEGVKHLAELEAERQRLAAAQALLEEEQKRTAALRAELSDRDQRLEERELAQNGSESRAAALEAELADLKSAKEQLASNLSAGGKESANLKGELTKAKKAADEAAAAGQKSKAENQRLAEDLRAAKQELAKAAEERKALAEARAGLEAKDKEAAELQAQLDSAQREAERLSGELGSAKQEAASLAAAGEEAQRKLQEEAQSKVMERELALEASAKKEEEAKLGAGQRDQENADLKRRVEELEAQLAQVRASEKQQQEALQKAEEKQTAEAAVHKAEIDRLSEIANQVSAAEARATGLASAAVMAEKHLATAESAGRALQEERKLRRAAEDQLLHAQGQIEELRRELAEKGDSQGKEVETLRREVDSAHQELNGVLDERYQLQVALKAARRQLESGQDQSRGRIKQLEGAIRQAAKDYQMLLKQNQQLKTEAEERECELQATSEQLAYFQAEVARLAELVGYFEHKTADVARVMAEADHQRRAFAKMQEINDEVQARARFQALPPTEPAPPAAASPPPKPESPRPQTPPEPQRSFKGRERMIPPTGFMG